MKSTELRIGNYFKTTLSRDRGKPIKCTGVNGDRVYFDDRCAYNISKVKPIPLTEEWLIKFGFTKDSDGCLVKHQVLYWLNSGILQIAAGYSPIINCPCKYVHQLQNLIFALTGEELYVKD